MAVNHVDHPQHYGGDTPYEAIKVIEAWLGRPAVVMFCLANAMKYICRHGKKPDVQDNGLRDLQKARWYLDYAIKVIETRSDEVTRP